jgi:hypothetical protein
MGDGIQADEMGGAPVRKSKNTYRVLVGKPD